MPQLSVTDGGAIRRDAISAKSTVTGVVDGPEPTLEGVTPALTYYAGNSTSGSPLTGGLP